ncbi:MAG TPA: hypothetical protein VI337_00105 [Nitrospirales bacterium]|jgi:hypothetical protein|nr:hypothetical protein [Nitrospirales bacterium]
MKAILAALFAVMIGLTFAGSTFAAEEKKMDAPAAAPSAPPAGGEMKKDEGKKDEGKAADKTKKKKKKSKEEKEKEKEKGK